MTRRIFVMLMAVVFVVTFAAAKPVADVEVAPLAVPNMNIQIDFPFVAVKGGCSDGSCSIRTAGIVAKQRTVVRVHSRRVFRKPARRALRGFGRVFCRSCR